MYDGKQEMMLKEKLVFAALCLLLTAACKKTYWNEGYEVAINEVMPHNKTTAIDDYGEYDDWIELYNLSASPVDLSGCYLSDSGKNVKKWKFPNGSVIDARGFLIIWADGDSTQLGLHTNFKLSSSGEKVIFSRPDGYKLDEVKFPGQTLELSYSRVPDGNGIFKWQKATFNKSNRLTN